MIRHTCSIAVIYFLLTASASAAVFQYSAEVDTRRGPSTAFLWIPPRAAQVRGVVMVGMTLMEREFAKDDRIRRACADQCLAIVFLKRGLGSVEPQQVLNRLAEASGYHELTVAPLLFVGHSAGGPQAKAHATALADRCFGLVLYRGGILGGDDPLAPGVPALVMLGQFDEFGGVMRDPSGRETWQGGRDALIAFRSASERNLAGLVVEPGAGHFAWSDRNAAYLAMFIRKAAQAKIPEHWHTNSKRPVTVKRIDPRDGYLSELLIEKEQPRVAPYQEYSGDKASAAWHFDEEIAEATIAYHVGLQGKRDQFIRWNDPHWVDAGARFFFTKLDWVGDGQTLRVDPVYADTYPSQYNGHGPVWAAAGKRCGHSNTPIRVRTISGPMVATGPRTMRIRYDKLAPATERSRITFMAYSEGDAIYRYTEQVGMTPRNFRGLDRGAQQTITFPPLDDLRADAAPRRLSATSDSGLPVEFYVASGPAQVVDGHLHITDLPVRASFPIEVEVVAYQFGSGVEPLFRTAEPVSRTLHIQK